MEKELQLFTTYPTLGGGKIRLIRKLTFLNKQWWKGARFIDAKGNFRDEDGKVIGADSILDNICIYSAKSNHFIEK